MRRYFEILLKNLALFLLDFIATEVLFCLGEDDVLSQDWIVFSKAQLVWSVHRILLGVILTNARFLRNQTNEFALSVILLCHNILYFITTDNDCKQ